MATLPLKSVLETSFLHYVAAHHSDWGLCGLQRHVYTATKPVRIATVPVGYFEGIDRGLSNIGSMLVRGKRAPLAGRVSMNMSSLDVTDIADAAQGDPVIAISRNPQDQNSVQEIAKLANTTPYVILAHIPQHLKRVVE
jgi:alanine racemase